MALATGTRFGPYEISGLLGAGGMGEVYRAKDTRLGRSVAIKVLPPDVAADPERKRRFEQEARAVSALNHPNICALYDIGSASLPGAASFDYLVMEFVEGQSLADRIARGPLPLREALEVAAQIADALSKAHRHGIVHRDIKPGNVILTKEGAKLLDFGLAKARPAAQAIEATATQSISSSPLTQAGVIVGTVPYMAPEQLEGRETDARTDIFAFGAMLYEMLTGRRAFEGETQASIIAGIMTADPPSFAERQVVTPASVERLIRLCLAKDPDKRWQSAGDIARHIEGILEELRLPPSSSQIPMTSAPPRSGVRRMGYLAVGVLAVAALAGAAFLVARRVYDRPLPTFKRLTFRRGTVQGARFTVDGQNILFTALWDGDPRQVFSVRSDSVDATLREGLQGMNVLAVSSRNEIALLRGFTLAKAPLAGGAPREFESGVSSADWSRDGLQLAVTRGVGTINPVEYPIGKVIYKTTQTASDVRISPRGDLLAFREHDTGHGYVVVIDTEGHVKVRSAFHDGVEPPVWTPDGREVWFTVSIPHGRIPVLALDLSGRERNVLTDPTLKLKDISRDGRVLLSAEEATYSINVRAPGSTSERNLTWYSWSMLEHISSDGRTMAFTEGGESDPENGWSTFVRSTDGSPPQRFDDLVYGMLSPDGKRLAGMTDDKEGFQIKVVPTGAGQAQLVTHGSEGHNIVGWLPDSSGIVYWDHNPAKPEAPDRIWLATLDGRPPTPVTPDGWIGIGMGPNGNGVLAQTSALNDPRTFLFSLDGREQKLLPGVSANKWVPIGWDPDGKRVRALTRALTVPIRVFRVDPMTGDAQPWKELGGQLDRAGLSGSRRVAFSADGESYAYSYTRRLSTLYIVEGLR